MVKGSKMSSGARARISSSLRASYASGKRKPHTAKAVAARAEQCRGTKATEAQRRGLAVMWQTKKRSETHRVRIGASRRKYFESHPEAKVFSLERKAPMSAALKRRWDKASPAERELHSQKSSEAWARATPEQRAKRLAKWRSPDAIERSRRSASATWKRLTPEQRKRRLKRAWNQTSGLETAVAALMDSLGVMYLWHVPIGRYQADFVIPAKKLVVECDGEYWHRDKARDDRRDAYMLAQGYSVLRLPGKQIKSGEAERMLKLVV